VNVLHRRSGRRLLRQRLRAFLLFSCLACSSTALALDEAEVRGKLIYFDGISARGTNITAVVGDEAAMLPGSAMPCASCHGSDGLGRPEGGLLPLDIRWSELVKTYGHVHENGRRHPAFDEASFARSMVGGVDPANNQMDRSMPLYQMSSDDMADLIAYMKVLEYDDDPGVSEDRVQVATLLPLNGPVGETGQAMAQVMQAKFSEINEKGGIFGRKIDLLVVPLGSSPDASIQNMEKALDAEGVFAVVGAYSVGLDEALLGLMRKDHVPLVGPFTLDPGDAFLDAAAFYLYPGLSEQAGVLAEQALSQGAAPGTVAVAGPASKRIDPLVKGASDRIRKAEGGPDPIIERYADEEFDAAALAEGIGDSEALIFFGSHTELEALLGVLSKLDRAPRIYLLSSLLAKPLFDAPAAFDQRMFIAYPTLSSDVTQRGREEYQLLAETYSLPHEHVQAQLAALAAAKLLVEGLRRAGRTLSRVRLVEGIEDLYEFKTGVTPPLTYGPNRRIGALGAHIVVVDLANKRYAPLGDGWHKLR
jgi:ABC-type branched-subunit amino acid transport system substrate-binding protein